MRAFKFDKTTGIPAIVLAAALTFLPQALDAQEMPRGAAELSAGWIGFADDGVVSETPIGGAVRWHVSPRVSVGPEVLWINGSNHSHLALTGNVTFDLLGPTNGHPARVTPFIVLGAGMFQTKESFANDDFTSTEGAFTAGGGIRANPTNRLTVGVDARLGWETHIRINGFVGVRF